MSLVSKLKNILFEEEEIEIPIIEKKESKPTVVPVPKKNLNEPKKEETVKNTDFSEFFQEDLENAQPVKKEEPIRYKEEDTVSEREIFRSEKTFNFPAFDEEEFNNLTPKPRTTNVMEFEKRKSEKKQDYKTPLKKEEKQEKAKFKPSPIISPVYGILDKNYTPDEITSRKDSANSRTLDVDSVRKKAFGSLEETKKLEVIKDEEMEDKIFEERLEKARTIDELLNDSSDDIIDIKEEDKLNIEDKEIASFDDVETLDDIKSKQEEKVEEDIESDLFDLIDSMYENREDGE